MSIFTPPETPTKGSQSNIINSGFNFNNVNNVGTPPNKTATISSNIFAISPPQNPRKRHLEDYPIIYQSSSSSRKTYFDHGAEIRENISNITPKKPSFEVSLPDGSKILVSDFVLIGEGCGSECYRAINHSQNIIAESVVAIKVPLDPTDPSKDGALIKSARRSEFTNYLKTSERLDRLKVPYAQNYTVEQANGNISNDVGCQVLKFIPPFDVKEHNFDEQLIKIFTDALKDVDSFDDPFSLDLTAANTGVITDEEGNKKGCLYEITHPDGNTVFENMGLTIKSFFPEEIVKSQPERKENLQKIVDLWKTSLGPCVEHCNSLKEICQQYELT